MPQVATGKITLHGPILPPSGFLHNADLLQIAVRIHDPGNVLRQIRGFWVEVVVDREHRVGFQVPEIILVDLASRDPRPTPRPMLELTGLLPFGRFRSLVGNGFSPSVL